MRQRRGRERKPLSPRARRILQVVGFGAGAFALGYLLTMLLFFPGWDREAIVTVPDLQGRTLAQARRLADRADLELERGDTLAHPTVPAGAVLAQSPLPGQEVTRGSAVRVILSGGPDRRPVPEVEALTAEDAVSLLRRTGFRVLIRRVESDRPAGRVLGVNPAPGAQVLAGGAVELTLSAGPPAVAVPAVAGLPLDAARQALSAAGLRAGTVEYDPGSPAAPGEVVAQSPAAGASLPGGSGVRLVVAGFPPPPEPAPEAPEGPEPDSVPPAPPPGE